ncbi:transglutaminase domain-containing protein [Neotabrizicola sp. sgz301269]|uniref:transglutaminase family protein n=1 Tax=Neotabrizicola sp. sgz301269 TaxID=3276282 RepID=UPI0037701F12
MRYQLNLTIQYEFERPPGLGRQLLRVHPAQMTGVQSVEAYSLTMTPAPLEQGRFTDFYGFQVAEFTLPPGLEALRFSMSARVERQETGPRFDLSVRPDALAAEIAATTGFGPAAPHHYLAPSPHIPRVAEIEAFARKAAAGAGTVAAMVEALGLALNGAMTFDPRATEADTPIARAFSDRRGVCQDLSQIMVAGLRSLGIPAAYVSGYLRTLPPPGKLRLVGADAMHAWVRAWTGIEGGWLDYDPTNACFVGADHVTVGAARDYSEAAPVIGMLRMQGHQSGSHSVDIVEI